MSAAAAKLAGELEPSSALPAAPPAAAPAPVGAPGEVGEIDAQLAKLTDSLLDESHAPKPPVAPAKETLGAAAPAAAPPPGRSTSTTSAIPAAAPTTGALGKAAEKASASSPAPALAESPPAGSSLGQVVLRLLARPIAGRSRTFRDTVGWAAVVTLFWAAGLWGYVLILHVPPAPRLPPNAPVISTGDQLAEGSPPNRPDPPPVRGGAAKPGKQ